VEFPLENKKLEENEEYDTIIKTEEFEEKRVGQQVDIPNPIVKIENLTLKYSGTPALIDINMEIPKYKATAFIGPSGCGKSTLIRCLIV